MMKPKKLVIEGEYLDSQIYRGRLYLWTFDGRLVVYDWNSIVNYLYGEDNEYARYVFKEGAALYNSSLHPLFKDNDFKKLLERKIGQLKDSFVPLKKIRGFIIGEMDVPTKELPIDTEIYGNNLYFSTEHGLYKTTAHKNGKYPVSSRPKKLWDAIIQSIKAGRFPQFALAAGNDGLYELNDSDSIEEKIKSVEANIFEISKKHSTFANYSNTSIYSSSSCEESFMALFGWEKNEEYDRHVFPSSREKAGIRSLSRIEFEEDIFEKDKNTLMSWACDGKIFKITNKGFDCVSFNSFEKDEIYKKRKRHDFEFSGRTLSCGSAYFGNIVEFEKQLNVYRSDGAVDAIDEPVVRWRVFPRSHNYENHLHVILEDRIEILSFNHDYFVKQDDDKLGVTYKERAGNWQYRL